MSAPIIVIGAGLSGLSAALELERHGESCLVLEAQDHIGGKLETSIIDDAYRIDRGFQVLLPAYPELQRFENLESELNLKEFSSGARLETDAGTVTMANPLEHPEQLFSTALGTYGTLQDKLLVLKLAAEVRLADADSLLKSVKGSTRKFLTDYGFSDGLIEKFWSPFFSGIFLEPNLATEAGFFRYLVKMFASSRVAVPARGIGELPSWMSRRLTRSEIQLSTKVQSNINNVVELADGKRIEARAVITSTSPSDSENYGAVTSFWFSAPEPPYEGAWLSLNSRSSRTGTSLNHVAVLSNVSSEYAMKGDALICANVVGHTPVPLQSVMDEAIKLYGPSAKSWKLLREDRILNAFPLYLNRSDDDTPSQQGALLRGRKAAQAVLSRL